MYDLYAQFPKQQISKDRQYSALLRWAAFIDNAGPPDPVTDAWIEQKIIAERVPQSPDQHVLLTMPYMIQIPDIQTNIREHMHPFATDGAKVSLDAQVDSALAVVMPKFCTARVTQQEIDQWRAENP